MISRHLVVTTDSHVMPFAVKRTGRSLVTFYVALWRPLTVHQTVNQSTASLLRHKKTTANVDNNVNEYGETNIVVMMRITLHVVVAVNCSVLYKTTPILNSQTQINQLHNFYIIPNLFLSTKGTCYL